MNNRLAITLISIAAASHGTWALAQNVPREDARTAAQTAQAQEAARRDARAADAMEKARLKQEAQPVQAYIPAPATAAPTPDRSQILSEAQKPAVFKAIAPAKPGAPAAKKKKKKARARQAG